MNGTYDWRGRRVLVTGATGIVGGWLTEALVARGADVIALVRDDDPQSRFMREGIVARCRVVRGELGDLATCLRAINDYETSIVFHLGAQTIVGAAVRDPLECFESNIRGTYNLLEAVRRLRDVVNFVVVASSDKAYGESDVLPYTEDMPLRGRHPYDVSKSCTDLLADTYAHTYGLPIGIARCGNIYGGGDLHWSRLVPGTIRSLLAGERPIVRSDGAYTRDFIYVKDVVTAYLAIVERSSGRALEPQAYNFSPQQPATVLDIVAAISRLMNVPLEPVVTNVATSEIVHQALDASRAHRLLDWRAAHTLEDGLRETIEWYRAYLGAPAAVR